MQRGGCVYIMTNKQNAVFYTGVTSDLIGRAWDHKNKTHPKSLPQNTIAINWFTTISIHTLKKQLLLKNLLKVEAVKVRST